MAGPVQQIYPVAHLPLVLGVLRRLEVATVIDQLIPPHPAHVLSYGRGVEALVLAILDGHHALYFLGRMRRCVSFHVSLGDCHIVLSLQRRLYMSVSPSTT
jgi:hypothetical protein